MPFGADFPKLDDLATGEWWERAEEEPRRPNAKSFIEMKVPRDEVVAFAVYTVSQGTLKLSAQLFPLLPEETRVVRLETRSTDAEWKSIAEEEVIELGWSAHFRVENWDHGKDVAYRVRHGETAAFEGRIRRDPGRRIASWWPVSPAIQAGLRDRVRGSLKISRSRTPTCSFSPATRPIITPNTPLAGWSSACSSASCSVIARSSPFRTTTTWARPTSGGGREESLHAGRAGWRLLLPCQICQYGAAAANLASARSSRCHAD